VQEELEGRYPAAPLHAVFGARSHYQTACVVYAEGRAARLTDSAALLDSMGTRPP
jgi:hypothetical protein